jgi:hypothetical protein
LLQVWAVIRFAAGQSGGITVKAPGTGKFRPATAFFAGSNLFDLMLTGQSPGFVLYCKQIILTVGGRRVAGVISTEPVCGACSADFAGRVPVAG